MELVHGIRNFIHDEDGVTAIEYALVASLIALAAITAMGSLGTSLGNMFTFISGKLKTS